MDNIRLEIEELIFSFITKMGNPENITGPNDIIDNLSYDAIEEIKDRIWDLMKQEINCYDIYDEIEKFNEDNKSESEDEEDH